MTCLRFMLLERHHHIEKILFTVRVLKAISIRAMLYSAL
jgi:hypothetical protein